MRFIEGEMVEGVSHHWLEKHAALDMWCEWLEQHMNPRDNVVLLNPFKGH
ncbi:hypothetical protein ACFOD0_04195 [Shewanella intestini]|uniref:Transposase n=1 Tax=Shewanella intestini TaxID=2017544 RepID=A0ABS5I0Z7_9GAMM|nr:MULTISPECIES: hypothetical protein [Shewanella]MBR9727503.1 hypothetical protein [Shewanella intestini]MRG35347.1 hypothetical protein [Shewanella sp. XMDDZSB0408]